MEFNKLVADIALSELDKFKSDSTLYDAIVEGDIIAILYLVNNKYRLNIANRYCAKEPKKIKISSLLQSLELGLSKNKQIRLINQY